MEIEKERTWATMAALFLLFFRFPNLTLRASFGDNDAAFLKPPITVSFAQPRCEQTSAVLYNTTEECHIKTKNN